MKKKVYLLFFCSMFLLFLTACNSEEDVADSETETVQIDPVKKYQQKCQMCHGANLNDGLSSAKDLSKIGAKMSKEEIERIIIEGAPGMPKAQLKGAEVKAVAEWLANMK